MKYLDEYRDPGAAQLLLDEIRRISSRCWTLMEVCGGQTHSLLRHGIAAELQGTVELIHGPGCPVCVTDQAAIDFACQLAQKEDVVLTSFGDMLRVPGSRGSLLDAQTAGANIRIVYSPLDAVELARTHPEKQFVFFAVGFETTAPATALAIKQAGRYQLENFSFIVSHVRVQPAMESLVQAPDHRVQAFLAAGHVCTVMGFESYEPFVKRYQLPVVVTGFEPLDLLEGILACVKQLEANEARLENRYARTVRSTGNLAAQDLVQEIYQVCDSEWRGFGMIPEGGLELRPEWQNFDARMRFTEPALRVIDLDECRSFEVMTGHIKPPECPHFGKSCNPESPLGAPMVSSEGACAAYYRYDVTAS
ncbi:MAG: hydrogenase formation protein HypD [Planctomycetes bacterium]|nr:hydrogenase formation protein HypD [Planctomycetota bacterium]MCH9727289.1 hydrogenase formation protein HypD [Planctomycetota bacterium]MCH9779147.1 hydrogenase formation protein HypD [Planctomycetota bacterium]MCH9792313.1 hydrogenase formation protein HypD [Planctomycetota bacterium]MDF1745879.1 hydrogenase formation protein HypD [Gimesia sp.]